MLRNLSTHVLVCALVVVVLGLPGLASASLMTYDDFNYSGASKNLWTAIDDADLLLAAGRPPRSWGPGSPTAL